MARGATTGTRSNRHTWSVVPLIGENRAIAVEGLARMRQTESPGILELAATAGLTLSHLSARDVVFSLAPRMNAMGRLGDAAG